MVTESSVVVGGSMEIIRQRLFIDHDSKSQKAITVEYTIRSKLDKLKNIFLNYEKFLPNLIIQDAKNSMLPLMSSKDIELLYNYHIEITDGGQKLELQNELKDIKDNKKYLIWVSLKNDPLLKNEIRTFTLSYMPEIQNVKRPTILIKINKQNYPVYYSLFSSNNFNFNKPKFTILKDNMVKTINTPPKHVNIYNSYQSMSLRITTEIDYDLILTYSFGILPSSKSLTVCGSFILSSLPIAFLIIATKNISGFELFTQKQIEIALFVIGASLVLPSIQPDLSIRRSLMLWYLLPIIFAMWMIFS